MNFKWETLVHTHGGGSYRAKVIGGWVVNSTTTHVSGSVAESSCFVPDPKWEWKIENAREFE